MMLFRSARSADLDAIHNLAKQSGVGLTTLPKNKELIKKRLQWSTQSYEKVVSQPEDEYYLFVLEDTQTQTIIGTSAIEAQTGFNIPFYSYKVSHQTRLCPSLTIRSDYDLLTLVNDNQGKSEVCTLFLDPKYRGSQQGVLLSRGRFLFMGQHSSRFSPQVIAELRGVSNDAGDSPFWQNIGAHFFHMPFAQADRLTLATNKQFITDLIPHNPIYVPLLSAEAQAVIGKPHHSSMAAMNILISEGFRYNHYVDIFDAGPTLEAPLSQIKTIRSSEVMTLKNISDEVSGSKCLLSNTLIDFRATLSHVVFNKKEKSCIISKESAHVLQLNPGCLIRIAPL